MKLAALFPWVLALVVVGGLGGSWWHLDNCRTEAAAAQAQLEHCRTLATKIVALQAAPQKASLAGQSLTALTAIIEQAAVKATINASDIVRIDPQALRRAGDTPYKEQATEVELRSVTLKQLAGFVTNIRDNDSNLQIQTIRLRVPHDATDGAEEKWLAEAILTQRIYAPKSTTPRSR